MQILRRKIFLLGLTTLLGLAMQVLHGKMKRNPYKRTNHGSSVITDSMLADTL